MAIRKCFKHFDRTARAENTRTPTASSFPFASFRVRTGSRGSLRVASSVGIIGAWSHFGWRVGRVGVLERSLPRVLNSVGEIMSIDWSAEIPFTQDAIETQVPIRAGVYEILQSEEYPRYAGKTKVLKIGKSESDLRQEISNHFMRHTAANRLARVRNHPNIKVSVRFAVISDGTVGEIEKQLLCEFEDKYWDIPVLNAQRGYGRNQDAHYRQR